MQKGLRMKRNRPSIPWYLDRHPDDHNLKQFKKDKNSEMLFCYQNCSDLLWEKIVLVIEKEQFIQIVKGQNNFWQQNAF